MPRLANKILLSSGSTVGMEWGLEKSGVPPEPAPGFAKGVAKAEHVSNNRKVVLQKIEMVRDETVRRLDRLDLHSI